VKKVNAKKHIFKQQPVNNKVKNIFRQLAYKFNSIFEDYELQYKITNFRCLVLVMRGKNVEKTIDEFYDREKLLFKQDVGFYSGTPAALFLTNKEVLDVMLSFLLNTRYIKLYNDFHLSTYNLLDSDTYSFMITHNVKRVENDEDQELYSLENVSLIKERQMLMEEREEGIQQSQCICLVKPNQPFNVGVRILKTIANNENLELKIQDV